MSYIKQNRRLLLFIVLMVVFRSAIADWSPVPTGSMKPTILEGDVVFVNKHAYDIRIPLTSISLKRISSPERGDIVVFESEKADLRMLKRIIGLPGDKITMLHNQLFINGRAVSYLFENENNGTKQFIELLPGKQHKIQLFRSNAQYDNFAPITVPQDHYFVMGDNRQNSSDSRIYGFVPHHELRGRTERVIASFNIKKDYLPRFKRFWKSI